VQGSANAVSIDHPVRQARKGRHSLAPREKRWVAMAFYSEALVGATGRITFKLCRSYQGSALMACGSASPRLIRRWAKLCPNLPGLARMRHRNYE
jgi:hypothetical protein